MAWNQPGEDKKRPPPRGAPDNSSLDDLLRRLQRQMQRLGRPGSNRTVAALALLLVLAALWLLSGLYQLSPSERGVVQRFGRYLEIEQPRHGWHWPWPIETMTKVDVAVPEGLDSKALLVTSDQNFVDVNWSVQYRVAAPLQYLFQVRDPQDALRQASETVMRELVAGSALATLLNAEARARVAIQARERIQKILDGYRAGIDLAAVNLGEVRLPDAVQGAQRDASKAVEDRARALADAEGYVNDTVPKAQAQAARAITDAQVYATQTRATADGDAQRFTEMAQAYARAPEITRNRMYIDTMESILSHAHKIIIDTKSGNTIYVPLDKLAEAIRASGQGGQPASGSGPAGNAAAAGANGTAANSVPANAAAGNASPGNAPNAGAAGESADEAEARARERPER
jgi:modulator of FtsH protease HflK